MEWMQRKQPHPFPFQCFFPGPSLCKERNQIWTTQELRQSHLFPKKGSLKCLLGRGYEDASLVSGQGLTLGWLLSTNVGTYCSLRKSRAWIQKGSWDGFPTTHIKTTTDWFCLSQLVGKLRAPVSTILRKKEKQGKLGKFWRDSLFHTLKKKSISFL